MSTVYELSGTLKGSNPKIYRIFKVKDIMPLQILHEVMQALFYWENFHRHIFKDSNGKIIQNADCKMLHEIISEFKNFTYIYDLGNAWTVEIKLLKAYEDGSFVDCPLCLGGARKSPPEESGGIVGYQMAIEMLSKKDTRGNDLLYGWYGDNYNPEEFNLEEINKRLSYLRCQ
jgi:hypothetical protein